MIDDVRRIFGDTETTGFNSETGDRIIEIALVETIGLEKTGQYIHHYFNPEGRKSNPDALKVHGLTEEFLEDKALFSEHVEEIAEFIGDSTFVAHNAQFDVKFIYSEFKRCKFPFKFNSIEDTLLISRTRNPTASFHNLDALIKKYEIDGSKREKHHGALIDTELLIEVYYHLMGYSTLNLEKTTTKNHEQIDDTNFMPEKNRQIWFPDRGICYASDDETSAHMEFMKKKFEASIWQKYLSEEST